MGTKEWRCECCIVLASEFYFVTRMSNFFKYLSIKFLFEKSLNIYGWNDFDSASTDLGSCKYIFSPHFFFSLFVCLSMYLYVHVYSCVFFLIHFEWSKQFGKLQHFKNPISFRTRGF